MDLEKTLIRLIHNKSNDPYAAFRALNRVYLKRRIRASQLWRRPENRVVDVPVVVHEPYVPAKKVTPPKKGDYVYWSQEDKMGWIVYIARGDDREVAVRFQDRAIPVMFSLDLFEGNYTSKGGRTRWSI